MLLKQIKIKNFRGIEETSMQLKKDTLLIGENNTGKSSILYALSVCMSPALVVGENVFQPFDFHLEDEDAEPTRAKPIEMKLVFQETEQGEWDISADRRLEQTFSKNEFGYRFLTLRVIGIFEAEARRFKTKIDFLYSDGKIVGGIDKLACLKILQGMVSVYLLSSLRDAGQEFHPGSKFWEPILAKVHFNEETLAEIVGNLKDLNNRLLSGNEAVDKIVSRLTKLADILPLGREKTVLVEAIPTRPFDVLSRAQINLKAMTGAQIPIGRHGIGTQSVAVLLLIEAAARTLVQDSANKPMHPILALDEPEAHLHSFAEEAFIKVLPEISGQKIIITHSGKIMSQFDFENFILFRYKGKYIVSRQINKEEMEQGMSKAKVKNMWEKLDIQVLRDNADWLLSRNWFLVEGEVEDIVLSQCADSMGMKLSGEFVSVIKYSGLTLEYILKLANQFGIEWFLIADNDREGRGKVKIARNHLNGRKEENHIYLLDHGNMELFLCMNEFGQIYESTVLRQKKQEITLDKSKGLDYWKQIVRSFPNRSKVKNARIVAEKINKRGESAVPQPLKDVIKKVVKLARGAE